MPTSRHEARLIIHDAAPGPWNMAVDQSLLESAAQLGLISIRIYRWDNPTLSLGYFQNGSDRHSHPASTNCELIRRASGGGAILHDRELTYSIAIPIDLLNQNSTQDLYTIAHKATIEVLARVGVQLNMCHSPDDVTSNKPFLCFQRRASGDLLIGTEKVGGSAQRRLHDAVLQHGSLLLEKSSYCPELPGIVDISDESMSFLALTDHWMKHWPQQIADALGINLVSSELSTDEVFRSKKIRDEKFGHENWTDKR